MPKTFPWIALSAFAAAVLVAAPGSGAEKTCPQVPKVAFWGELTHDGIRRHVDDQLAGDWDIYIDQLETQQKTLRGIHERGSGAVLKRKGQKIKLAGKSLKKYLAYGDKRLKVVRCLAEAEMDGLTDFATAAGTPDEPDRDAAAKAASGKDMQRTFITMPKTMLNKLRDRAVRRSAKVARKISVNDIVVEILERDLRRSRR